MADTVEMEWYNIALTGSSSCLSILGGSVIIITYLRIQSIRNFTRTLLLYLTIADLLTAAGNLVATVRFLLILRDQGTNGTVSRRCRFSDMLQGNSTNQNFRFSDTFDEPPVYHEGIGYRAVCEGQSFVTTFSNLSSFVWTTLIAFHIWFSIMFGSRCVHVLFHVIGWIIPVAIVTPIAALGCLGEDTCYGTGVWCGIRSVAIVTPIAALGYLGEDTCYGTGVWCGIRSGLPRDMVERLMYIADIGWQLTCYVLTTFFCVCIKFSIWLKQRYGNFEDLRAISANLRNEDKNFIKIVLIIVSLKIWGILRFFLTINSTQSSQEGNGGLADALAGLLVLQSYGASGQAFWNFVLFCVADKVVRTHMKEFFIQTNSGESNTPIESDTLLNSRRTSYT